ncbi:MAG: GntG family PLP-dependent aldolase [Planctomycetota bacterium]|nr:GntG family PLP-dependent aldolase [Planctomycetota bacterium]MDA1179504.1 GntG family PLP-dependent aldolase [Planctomycetota bacterium]
MASTKVRDLPAGGPVDMRSDTVTRPTPEMRRAMAAAEVGDDVIEGDPTADRLEKMVAEQLGKEAAVFMPSGTMTNQIALRLHCQPGDEFLCEANCHILNMEQGAFASLSGLVGRPLLGNFGVLSLADFQDQIHAVNDHLTSTRLVCLENTHNRAAGTVQPLDEVEAICQWAHANGLMTHLDGARLFNASVASGIDVQQLSQSFDTVSVCFSKGLGAPIGSALAGPRDAMVRARRHRKAFGGGMRQSGIIAAAAIYALEHHVQRLAVDHEHAQQLGQGIRNCEYLSLHPDRIDTNIVIFHVDPAVGPASQFVRELQSRHVLVYAVAPQLIRAVTHLDLNAKQITYTIEMLNEVVDGLAKSRVK